MGVVAPGEKKTLTLENFCFSVVCLKLSVIRVLWPKINIA